MAGFALELGASIAISFEDPWLGIYHPHHGSTLDLGIFLDSDCTPVSIYWNRWLDYPCYIQLFASCALDLVFRAGRQNRL